MRKRFKGEICAYCSQRPAVTGDHIFAREFFLEPTRGNLPKAPVCDPCNNAKSQLELYLTSVLPFGGRHADALENLATMVPKRLRGNARLHRELAEGRTKHTVPFDGARLEELVGLIARGLAWHHWRLYLDNGTHAVHTLTVTAAGAQFYDETLFRLKAHARVVGNVGKGTFAYEGVQAADDRSLTVWRFLIYGGVAMSDGTESGPLASQIVVITAPKAEIQCLMKIKRGHS